MIEALVLAGTPVEIFQDVIANAMDTLTKASKNPEKCPHGPEALSILDAFRVEVLTEREPVDTPA